MMDYLITDGSSEGIPPERSPRSSSSRDSTLEDQEIPSSHLVGNKKTKKIKRELKDEVEEVYVREDENDIEEETSPDLLMGSSQESCSSSHHDQDDSMVDIKHEEEEGARVMGGEPCRERIPHQNVPCLKITGGEELIEQARNHPELYDPRDRQYKNKDKKKRAWQDVASNVIIGWGGMKPRERDQQVILLQKRWRNMRDSFKKELKFRRLPGGSGSRPHTPYQYFESMAFLKDCLDIRPSSQELSEGRQSSYRRGLTRRNRTAARQTPSDPWTEISGLIRNLRQQFQEDRNPMLHFLKSMLPTMEGVDPSYHCDMKIELLDVVEKYNTLTARLHQPNSYMTQPSNYEQPQHHQERWQQP